jgi:hypothetical protein
LAKNAHKRIIPCIYSGIDLKDIKWGLQRIQGPIFEDKFDLIRKIRISSVTRIVVNSEKDTIDKNEELDKSTPKPITESTKKIKSIFFENKSPLFISIIVVAAAIAIAISILVVPGYLYNSSAGACGTQVLGISIFGKWKWVGTNDGATQSGITTFNKDCTYTNVATAGFTVNSNGHFNISSTPTTAIKLLNNFGKEQVYLVNKIHEDSFHLHDLNNIIHLDFIRMS